ncbi:MAG: type III-A CRISPR-associated RAMP protein Csm3 [bacterium]
MNEQKNAIPKKMLNIKFIQGFIKVETGLHIGGSSDIIMIAGIDNPIILNPVNKEPFIPGSSLKGKMRSLLEWKLGKLETNPNKRNFGHPYGYHPEILKDVEEGHPISRIFGTSAADEARLGPTRLIVRDAHISKKYKEAMREKNPNWTYSDLIEEKTENMINRITAEANPRPIQRVVTGANFELEMVYRIFDLGDDGDKDRELFQYVLD